MADIIDAFELGDFASAEIGRALGDDAGDGAEISTVAAATEPEADLPASIHHGATEPGTELFAAEDFLRLEEPNLSGWY